MTIKNKSGVVLLLWSFTILIACNDSGHEESPYSKILSEQPFKPLTDSIRKNAVNPDLYYRRGILLKNDEHPEPALDDFRKAWSLSKKEEYAVALSNLLLQKNGDSAIRFLQEGLRNHPKSVFLKINLAEAYSRQNKSYEELDVLNDILKESPNAIDALMMKAEVQEKIGNKNESIRTLETAYSLAPFDAELSHQLAFKYALAKNSKAITLSDSLIRMDSSASHAEPYFFKGLYYSQTGNSVKAIEYFNEAIRHDYTFLDSYIEKGDLQLKEKKHAEALKTFETALAIAPSEGYIYYGIARAQEGLNKKEEAKLNYERAYSLDKTLTEANEAAERIGGSQ